MKKKFHPKMGEIVFGAIFSAVGMFMVLYSRTFPKVRSGGAVMTGPSFFPTLIGIIMFVLGILTILSNLRPKKVILKQANKNEKVFYKSGEFIILFFIIFIALYPSIVTYLGFFIGTFLFCFILMKLLHAKWTTSIVASLIIVLVSWVIFGKIAFVGLPTGIIFTGR